MKNPQCDHCKSYRKVKSCGRCKLARYCSSKCQRANWAEHKPECTSADEESRVLVQLLKKKMIVLLNIPAFHDQSKSYFKRGMTVTLEFIGHSTIYSDQDLSLEMARVFLLLVMGVSCFTNALFCGKVDFDSGATRIVFIVPKAGDRGNDAIMASLDRLHI